MVEPHSSNFRVITTNFLGVRIFRKFTVDISIKSLCSCVIYESVMNLKFSDRQIWGNNVDPDHTAPSFRTAMPGQTVQTQIRLLLEEQSDQGLHCLPFRLHLFDTLF